ncbi:MAG: 50S ribosome-binding GTPase [Planctomycetia bacterium]|nr:50S ribosome-binding GTPase [Planctomycetia bacterium]
MSSPPRAYLLTPAGRGALATIRVEGSRAGDVVRMGFQPAQARIADPLESGRVYFGHWPLEHGREEVVVCRRDRDAVEIHCHGGPAAARSLLEWLSRHGCRIASWSDWIAARSPDAICVEALIELARAPTERVAAILLDQAAGALSREVRAALDALGRGDGATAMDTIVRLVFRQHVGLHLTSPFRVVLAGRPNVGKSSLTNALAGYERAIVFDQPGTTRDVVTALVALDGWPVELSDTAGLRAADGGMEGDAAGDIEQQGIERARKQIESADLVLLLCDASQPWTAADAELLREIPDPLVVHTKCDLPPSPAADRPSGIATSAVTRQGLADLERAIVARLVRDAPSPCDAVPFLRRHVEALNLAHRHIAAGRIDAARAALERIFHPDKSP